MDEQAHDALAAIQLRDAILAAKAREAEHPHRIAGEYERPNEPGASDRWLVRCACGRAYRGSTRGIAFGGYHRHRDRMRDAEGSR